MVTKILLGMMVGCGLLWTGCGSSDSEPSSVTPSSNIQTMLDNKNYAGVITKLESIAKTDDDYLALGFSYMGLSGFDMDEIIHKLYDSNDTNRSPLMNFTDSVRYDKEQCDVPLSYINKATKYFSKMIDDGCSQPSQSLSSFEKEVCVYKGISQTLEAVTTLNYMKEDTSSMQEGFVDKKLKAASCAMEFAFNGAVSECSIYKKGNIHFKENNKVYEQITVYTNGAEYEFLLTDGRYTQEVIVTDGYCSLDDYATRVDDKSAIGYDASTYHACPINLNEDITTANIDNFTTKEFMINSFNEGVKSILTRSDDEVLIEIINRFKEEIYNSKDGSDITHIINESDMIKYLKKQVM
jgi:hypothetical protein